MKINNSENYQRYVDRVWTSKFIYIDCEEYLYDDNYILEYFNKKVVSANMNEFY